MPVPTTCAFAFLALATATNAIYTPSDAGRNGTLSDRSLPDPASGLSDPGSLASGLGGLTSSMAGPASLLHARTPDFESFQANRTAMSLAARVVYSPRITSPAASTVWVTGSTVTVTWCVFPPSYCFPSIAS